MTVTPFYAAVLALVFVCLALNVIALRRRHKVSLGDGGVNDLQHAMRVHGNFAEYVPFGLVLLALLELGGAGPVLLHILGGTLLMGRGFHIAGVAPAHGKLVFRQIGMVLTFMMLITTAVLLFAQVFFG